MCVLVFFRHRYAIPHAIHQYTLQTNMHEYMCMDVGLCLSNTWSRSSWSYPPPFREPPTAVTPTNTMCIST